MKAENVHLLSDGGPASPAARLALRADPRFPAAVRTAAMRLLEQHQGNRLLNLIVNDRGRFLVGLMALDLHFRPEALATGLTPGRLKALCAERGISSPTRTGALLTLMRLGGYVQSVPHESDRRMSRLEPTERLFAAQRERWRCQFTASAPLLPDASRALAVLDRPDFMRAMVLELCGHFHAGVRVLDHVPSLSLFSERNGGFFILFTLLVADREYEHGSTPRPISISALARKAGCSRAHVLKLLADAQAEGLIERSSSHAIVMRPRLLDELHDFFASGFLILTHCARRAIQAAGIDVDPPSHEHALSPAARPLHAAT